MTNPFKFGKAVSGEAFYDRSDTSRKLYAKLSGGASNVVMYAPRRYGKTSLVKKVLARFAEEGTPTICFNLNKIETIEKFCEQYSAAVCSLVGKGRETADLLATRFSRAISVSGHMRRSDMMNRLTPSPRPRPTAKSCSTDRTQLFYGIIATWQRSSS